MDSTMNAVSTDARSNVVPVAERRVRIWEDIIGNKNKDDSRNSDTFIYFGGLRYRKKSSTFAIRERKGAKEAVATLTEEDFTADPKWRTDILRATYTTIPAHRTINTELRSAYWKQVRIAYYGVLVIQSHSPSVWAGGTSVLVNTRQIIVWSDVQTEECPRPMPVEGSIIRISNLRGQDSILSDDFLGRIGAGWRETETDITHLLALRTILYERDDTIVYRPKQEGIKAKTLPQPAGYRRDAQPHVPIVFLTDASTKHGIPSVVKPLGVYGGDDRLFGRHNVGNIIRNLEESRERRGELKRLLAERVFHPDRVERMASAHGVDFETYLLALSGEKD